MYRIGEFSELSKTTIKTLRYYEKEGLLLPSYVDRQTGYRFYETKQLPELAKIISLRQIGLSINDIKEVLKGIEINGILKQRKEQLKTEISISNNQLLQINYLLEERNMDYQVVEKELPQCIVYYKEGVIKDFSGITNFVLSSADECLKTNPDMKCIEPDYSFISYLDGEYKENDIKIRYSQAVTKEGIPNDIIKFEKLKPVKAVCIYHKGTYNNLRDAYSFIMKWIEDNKYEIVEVPRERYIDGIWNKENEKDWLTEIQVPIKSKI